MYLGPLVTVLLGGTAAFWFTPGEGTMLELQCFTFKSVGSFKLSSSQYKLVFVLLLLLSSFLLKCNSFLEGISVYLKDTKLQCV